MAERWDVDTRAIGDFNDRFPSESRVLGAIDCDREFFVVRCVHDYSVVRHNDVVTASSRRNYRLKGQRLSEAKNKLFSFNIIFAIIQVGFLWISPDVFLSPQQFISVPDQSIERIFHPKCPFARQQLVNLIAAPALD